MFPLSFQRCRSPLMVERRLVTFLSRYINPLLKAKSDRADTFRSAGNFLLDIDGRVIDVAVHLAPTGDPQPERLQRKLVETFLYAIFLAQCVRLGEEAAASSLKGRWPSVSKRQRELVEEILPDFVLEALTAP